MRALVFSSYGSAEQVLSIKDVPKPVSEPGHVIVKVAAVGLNAADKLIMAGEPFPVRLAMGGIFRPSPDRVLGSDFAGTIESVGPDVTQYKVGDAVYGQVDFATGKGAFAEYINFPVSGTIALKPTNLTSEQAASIPISAQTAYEALRDTLKVQKDQKILINGASGGVGSFAVQIAKALGAQTTAICSTRNVEAAIALGADEVIDYTKEDFTANSTKKYDGILDIVGNHSIGAFRSVLVKNGTYVSAGGDPSTFFSRTLCLLTSKLYSSQYLKLFMSNPSHALLSDLKQLAEEGKLTPLIEK
ncbi:NADPH:quinone reductase, partial [Thraustotheca clavata]